MASDRPAASRTEAATRRGIAGGFVGFLLISAIAGIVGGAMMTAMAADEMGTDSLKALIVSGLWIVGVLFYSGGFLALIATPIAGLVWIYQRIRRR